jgi:phosphoglycolate phosphatase
MGLDGAGKMISNQPWPDLAKDVASEMVPRVVRVLVLWDVDHTLIENGGVSKAIYEMAYEVLTGRQADVAPVTQGRTDVAIMAQLLADNGCDPLSYPVRRVTEALVRAGQRSERLLSVRGRPLGGAVACLKRLAVEPGVVQSVLTGNIDQNALMKLRAFGMDSWVDWSVGGYGHLPRRGMLVPMARSRARAWYDFDSMTGVIVLVGDTPADVQAGRDGGARVIGVATGAYGIDQLRSAGADAVLPDLADVEAVLGLVREIGDRGPARTGYGRDAELASIEGSGRSEWDGWARDLACNLLDVPSLRARRWKHVQGVAARAERIAMALGSPARTLIAGAWLHDIGYSPVVAATGFHPLDAATYLTDAGVEESLVALVARHSAAIVEAEHRGLAEGLGIFPDRVSLVRDALWACDMTIGPTGLPVRFDDRIEEIMARYGAGHLVARSIARAAPDLRAAVDRTRLRLRQAGSDVDL